MRQLGRSRRGTIWYGMQQRKCNKTQHDLHIPTVVTKVPPWNFTFLFIAYLVVESWEMCSLRSCWGPLPTSAESRFIRKGSALLLPPTRVPSSFLTRQADMGSSSSFFNMRAHDPWRSAFPQLGSFPPLPFPPKTRDQIGCCHCRLLVVAPNEWSSSKKKKAGVESTT